MSPQFSDEVRHSIPRRRGISVFIDQIGVLKAQKSVCVIHRMLPLYAETPRLDSSSILASP